MFKRFLAILAVLFFQANMFVMFASGVREVFAATPQIRYVILSAGATGCSNGSTNYNHLTNTCGSGTATVYINNTGQAIQASSGGDTVRIRTGVTYSPLNENSYTPFTTGSASSRLTVEAYPGETVTFVGTGTQAFNQTNSSSSYTIYRNLGFSSTGAFSEVIGTQGHHLTFDNVNATGNHSLTSISGNVVIVNGGSHDNLFTGGEYHNPGADVQGGFFSGDGYPFYVTGDNNVVEYATIHNARGYGIHNYHNPASNASGNIYRYNTIFDTCQTLPTCSGILLGTGTNNKALSNVIYNITGTGVGAITGIHLAGTNAVAVNNTIVNAKYACISWDTGVSNGTVVNNICSGTTRNFYNTSTGDSSSAGRIATLSNNRGDSAGSGISTTANPGFTNAGGNDYTLAAGSAVIDAGIDMSIHLTQDINGITRPQGAAFDIGAYEFSAGGGSPAVAITGPTSNPVYVTTATTLALSGTCSDDGGCTSVTWANSAGGSGTATGTSSWSIPSIALSLGSNVITVTGHDSAANTGTDAITVTRNAATVDEPVLFLALDAGSGTTPQDTSGKGNHGSFGSGVTWDNAGKYGKALAFDGTGSLTLPDANSLDLVGGMTLSAWVMPTTVITDFSAIISKNDVGNHVYFLYAGGPIGFCNSNASPFGGFNNGGNVFACDLTALGVNVWTYVTVTYDGATIKEYRNGVLISSTPSTLNMITSTGTLQIGASVFGEPFIGKLDEIRIYNYARTLGQINTDMTTPLTIPAVDLRSIKLYAGSWLKLFAGSSVRMGQ